MLATAQEMCPNVLQHDSKTLQDIQQICDSKSRIPPDFVKNLVNDSLGTEIINKVNEMNLVIANNISDKVIDDVIDNLSRTYKGLVGDVGSLKKKRSLTPDVLKGSSLRLESLSESESLGGETQSQGGPSPISTPMFGKRKSVNDRKLRPKSTVDSGEGYSHGPGKSNLLSALKNQNSLLLKLELYFYFPFPCREWMCQVNQGNLNFVTRSWIGAATLAIISH